MDGELDEIVSAPIDEVTLLASDISVQDLPILIGDETVVFPGDDFSVGQGKILPKANEWMWLPWGWLLAHNDTHIWQWRPLARTSLSSRRPPGPAPGFSPDGRYTWRYCKMPREMNDSCGHTGCAHRLARRSMARHGDSGEWPEGSFDFGLQAGTRIWCGRLPNLAPLRATPLE